MTKTPRLIVFFVIIAAIATTADYGTSDAAELRVDSAKLGRLEFTTPGNPAHRNYLGLPESRTFALGQIQGDLLLIEIFSMYCPYCQRAAPDVNRLFNIISKNPKTRKSLKLIGIGIGNTPYEVDIFRKRFNIPFPLIPDEGNSVQGPISTPVRTPTFIVAELGRSSVRRIVDVHVGPIEDVEAYARKLGLR